MLMPHKLMRNLCPACGGAPNREQLTLTSLFFAARVNNRQPELVRLLCCANCDTRWYGRDLSDDDVRIFYDAYRSETYFRQRNSCEPWYTKAFHQRLMQHAHSAERAQTVLQHLQRAGVACGQGVCVLDYGGDGGYVLQHFTHCQRTVLDVSAVSCPEGIQLISHHNDLKKEAYDIILNMQVLEHVNNPMAVIQDIYTYLRTGGTFYVEVPDERWRGGFVKESGYLRKIWVEFLKNNHRCFMLCDFISTAVRVKLGYCGRWGVLPMREHINYFSASGFLHMVQKAGFYIVAQYNNGYALVAQKP